MNGWNSELAYATSLPHREATGHWFTLTAAKFTSHSIFNTYENVFSFTSKIQSLKCVLFFKWKKK